jgi:hypothetical protein
VLAFRVDSFSLSLLVAGRKLLVAGAMRKIQYRRPHPSLQVRSLNRTHARFQKYGD